MSETALTAAVLGLALALGHALAAWADRRTQNPKRQNTNKTR